jgi:hypothetical protein
LDLIVSGERGAMRETAHDTLMEGVGVHKRAEVVFSPLLTRL